MVKPGSAPAGSGRLGAPGVTSSVPAPTSGSLDSGGPGSAPTTLPESEAEPDSTPPAAYRLRHGDIVDIVVWGQADLQRRLPVKPDGTISVPLLNEVPAAGLTTGELRDLLIEGFADFVRAVEVTVIVEQVASFAASVLGEARNVGRYELRPGATVLELLAMAGGPTEFASTGSIVLLRRLEGGRRPVSIDYDDALKGDPEANPAVWPGDVLYIP